MNLLSILAHTVDDPGRAMRGAAERARSWWLPGLLILASTAALAAISMPYQMEQMTALITQVAERGGPDQSAQMLRQLTGEGGQGSPNFLLILSLTTAATGLVAAAGGWVARGGLLFMGNLLTGGVPRWGPFFAVGVWSMIPFAVRNMVQVIYIAIHRQLVEHQGFGFLAANSPRWLAVTLGHIDPFVLWHLILLAAGIAVVAKASRGKAALAALLVWGLLAAIQIVPAALSPMGGAL